MANKRRMKPLKWRPTEKRRRGISLGDLRKKGTGLDTSHIPWLSWPHLTPATLGQIDSNSPGA
jgi:hypothetical protein